ncbi:MAG: FHA domain-containing protein [Deltaproteobacteria bacterium]|nr:FHA domain-containing protein [Deltaproteobacteria bacterium]
MIFPTNIGMSLLGSTLVTGGPVNDPGKPTISDPLVSNPDAFSFNEMVADVFGSLMSFQIPAIFKETNDDLPANPRGARIFNYLDKTAVMLGQLEAVLGKRTPQVPLQYAIGDYELGLRERVRKLGKNFVKALEDPSINIARLEYEYAQLQEGVGLLIVFSNLDFEFLHTYRDPKTKQEIYIHRVDESVGLDTQFYEELVASLSEDGFVDFEYFTERLKELGEFCEVAGLRNHLREMMLGLSSVAVQEGRVLLRSHYDREKSYFSDDINEDLLNGAILVKALEAYEKISPEGAIVLGSLIDGLSQTREEWVFYRAFDPESFQRLLAAGHEFKNELEAAQLGLQWLQGFLADWMETQTRPLTDFVARELEYQQVLKLLSDPQADQAQITQTLNEELARVRGEMEVIWGDERLRDLKVARLLLEGQWNQFAWMHADSSDLVTGLDNLRVKYLDGGEILAIKKVLPANCGGLDDDCDGMEESLSEADFMPRKVTIRAAGQEAGVLLEAKRLIAEGKFTEALTHLKVAGGFITRAKMAIQVGQAKKDGMIDEARFEQVQRVFQLLTDRGEDGNPVSLALDFKQILAEEKKSFELKAGDWDRLSTQVAEHQTDIRNKRDYIGKAGHSGEFNLFFGDYYVSTTSFDRLLEGYGQLAREIELAKNLPEAEQKAKFWLLQERLSHLSASPLMERSLNLHGDVEQHKNLGNEIGITVVTLGAGAIANLAKMGVGLLLLRARSAGLALAFIGGMRNARWLVNFGGLAFKILGNSQVLRGTVFTSEVLSFAASEYVLMELLHEATGNEDFAGHWGWEKLILTAGTLGFIHKAMALYEQVILKLLFKAGLSLKNLPLLGKILYTAGRLGTEYVAFTAWDFISQVYLLAKENQLDWENLQTSVFSAKAMAHRAAFLCGLKLGGIVSQPLLSPLYKGVAASVQREFAGRIQSLNSRRVEAVDKLKGLYEGTAEEANSRLDRETLPLTKALDLENLNQELARLIVEEKTLLGDLAAVGLSSSELQARSVLLDAALKDYANLPKELKVFETLFDAQKGFGIHYDPETQSLVYQKEDHRALMTYLRGVGRVAKQRGGIIYFQCTGADGVPVGPELRFAVDPMSLVAHELPGGEAGKNLRSVKIDGQRAYVTQAEPEKLGPEALRQVQILFHGVKLLFQNIGRKLAEGANEIADSSRTNMPFGNIFGKLFDAGKLMVTRAGSVLSGKWRDINPYELLNSAKLEVAEGQALMAEASRVAPSLGREAPRTLTDAADILRAIETLERSLGPDCQWFVRKLKVLPFQERANLLLEFDRSQRNIAEVREAMLKAESFEQVANILRRQLQQPVWLRSEKVLTAHGQEDLVRFLEYLESYAMVGNLSDIVAFIDDLSQLTELGINQAVRGIIRRQFENYEARLRERRIVPVTLSADSFTGWRDPRSIITAWVGYKMAYAAIEGPDFDKPEASLVVPEVQGDATIYRLDPEYAAYEIGRRLEAKIQLDDPSLPEIQADIYFVNGKWVIKNVDPDTPLRINDVLLANDEVMVLRNGDRITLGETEFRFAIEGVVRGIRAKGPEAQLIKTSPESADSSERKGDSQFRPLASRGSNLESPENNAFQRGRIVSEVFPKVLHRFAEFEGNEALRTEHVDEYSKVLELVTNFANAIAASEIYDFYIFDDGTVSMDGKIGKLEEQDGGGFIFKPQGTSSPGEWAVLAKTLGDFNRLPPMGDYEIDIYFGGKRYHALGNHGVMQLAVDERNAVYQLLGEGASLRLYEFRGPADLHLVRKPSGDIYAYFQGRFFSSPSNEISPAKLGNESGYFLKKHGDVAGVFVDSYENPRHLDKGQESLLEGPQPLVKTQAVVIDRGSPLLTDPTGTYLIDTKDEVYHRAAHLPDGTFVEVNLQKLLQAEEAIKYVLIGNKIYFVQKVLSPHSQQWKLTPTQLAPQGLGKIVNLNAHASSFDLHYVMRDYLQSPFGDVPNIRLMGYQVVFTEHGIEPRTSFIYQGQRWAVHQQLKWGGQTFNVASPYADGALAEIALFKYNDDSGFYERVQNGHVQGQGQLGMNLDLWVQQGRIWDFEQIKSQMASVEQWFMARCIGCDPQTMESQNLMTFVRDGDGLRPATTQEMRDALARLKVATPALPSLQEAPLGPLEVALVQASVVFSNHRPLFIAKANGTNLVSDKPLKIVEYKVTEEIDGKKIAWVYAVPAADDPVVQVAVAAGYYIPTVNDIEAFHRKLRASVPPHDVSVVKRIILMPAHMGEATRALGSYCYADDRMVVSGAKAETQADWLAQVFESTLIHEVSGHGRERGNPYIRKLLELITDLSGKTADYGIINFSEYFAVWREFYERTYLGLAYPDQFGFFDFVDANARAGRTWAGPTEGDTSRPQALAGLAGTDGFLAIAAGFDAMAEGIKVLAGEVRETADTVVRAAKQGLTFKGPYR